MRLPILIFLVKKKKYSMLSVQCVQEIKYLNENGIAYSVELNYFTNSTIFVIEARSILLGSKSYQFNLKHRI